MRLGRDFFDREDVVSIARELLGCLLVTQFNDIRTSGIIVETEAYAGVSDRASHAWSGRRTNRTEIMFGEPGTAYVYLCYGIHEMFNIVTNKSGIPHAILIRAIEPREGISAMLERRNTTRLTTKIAAGPGLVAQALGINRNHNGFSLVGESIFVERGTQVSEQEIIASQRVGVAYAAEDALLPYRFRVANNPFVSRAK